MPGTDAHRRPVDDAARQLARTLLSEPLVAALAVCQADGAPFVSRIAWSMTGDGMGLTLVSDLAAHTGAMRNDPRVSILLGETTGRGDPLNQPRLTVMAVAEFVAPMAPERMQLRQEWLTRHPKALLYVDFADFSFVRFTLTSASMNGGFAKAYSLSADDLTLL